MLVPMRAILAAADKYRYGQGAFNMNSVGQIEAAVRIHELLHSGAILQGAEASNAFMGGELDFMHGTIEAKKVGAKRIGDAVKRYGENSPVPIALHLDHGKSIESVKACIDGGYTSVMIDGSSLPYEQNVELTREVVKLAHPYGVSVEGELGCIGSLETLQAAKEDGHGAEGKLTRDMLLTDPNQAAEFVRATQLDALAIAIGTSHGAYKFTRRPTGEILSIDRVKEIHARLPNTHLVMHGSSSVPQEYLAEIREFGGDMRETYGVPVEEIQKAIKHGVRKVNVDTDIRLAMTAAIRRYLVENPSGFDPRAYLKAARKAAENLCRERYLAFGCEGQGAKIKPIPLEKIAALYADGTLRQHVL